MSEKSVALQEFMAHAVTVQSFERIAQQAPGWDGLDVVQRQAVNVTLDAIARVLHGDAQNPGVWACGGAALTLAGEFVTFTPADELNAQSQPDADGWIEWKGGAQPVPNGTSLETLRRDGIVRHWSPEFITWSHDDKDVAEDKQIVAYRVVK